MLVMGLLVYIDILNIVSNNLFTAYLNKIYHHSAHFHFNKTNSTHINVSLHKILIISFKYESVLHPYYINQYFYKEFSLSPN